MTGGDFSPKEAPWFFFGLVVIITFSLPTNNSHKIVQNELYPAKKD
jgi:hypothetical protein